MLHQMLLKLYNFVKPKRVVQRMPVEQEMSCITCGMMCVLLSFVLSGNFRYLFVFIDFFQTFALIEHCIQFCCTCTMTNILFYFLFTNPAVASFNLPLVLDKILLFWQLIFHQFQSYMVCLLCHFMCNKSPAACMVFSPAFLKSPEFFAVSNMFLCLTRLVHACSYTQCYQYHCALHEKKGNLSSVNPGSFFKLFEQKHSV